ncbi:MAG: hypothetical protein IK113_07490 [Bacteroidales bacterium]|nr:hypothetical protein [Bacteroidales bacterium]
MKTIKLVAMAVVACMALCFTSCSINDPGDSGSYTATCDVAVSASEGSGIIFNKIRDAVILAGRGLDFRTEANNKVVIDAADKVAAEYKDQANKPIVVSVVFRPGNAMGEAEKADIVIKKYTFTPVN